MIDRLGKRSFPLIFSLLTLVGCGNKCLENSILEMKQFLQISTNRFSEDLKPKYDDSMLKKWYNVKDQREFAERMLGSSDYENYDIVVPFPGGKWTRTSFAPIIDEIFKSYIGFKESWPKYKKEAHLAHYNQYLENFLIRIGDEADINKDNLLSMEEFEELKMYKTYTNGLAGF